MYPWTRTATSSASQGILYEVPIAAPFISSFHVLLSVYLGILAHFDWKTVKYNYNTRRLCDGSIIEMTVNLSRTVPMVPERISLQMLWGLGAPGYGVRPPHQTVFSKTKRRKIKGKCRIN